MRSFIAASTTMNSLAPFFLRYSTRVSNTPAAPTIERPGSIMHGQAGMRAAARADSR